MEIHHFNEQLLIERLDRLPSPFKVLFAATVAERLFPAYTSYSRLTGRGNPQELCAALECLWLDLEGRRMDTSQVRENLNSVVGLIPREDDDNSWVPEQAWAEDAGAAVAYALRCRENGQSAEAAWAARRAYEALDHMVTTKKRIDTSRPAASEEVLSSPLIQAELSRQQRDLDELLAGDLRDVASVARRMRQRARAESITNGENA
jgi:uncharacterized protein YjaG (DUF416 family)